MRMHILTLIGGITIFLHGCAIHPLPEDIARARTSDIVEKIWCETRHALDVLTIGLLRRNGDSLELMLADRIQQTLDHPDREHPTGYYVRDIFPKYTKQLSRKARISIQFLGLTAIGFDYRFFLKETNNNGGSLALTNPFVSSGMPGSFSLTLGGSKNKQRSSDRKFIVVSTFYEIQRYTKLDPHNCAKFGEIAESHAYPITGKIGVEEVIGTFSSLLKFGLGDASQKNLNAVQTGRFTDQLIFTTELNSEVKPSITLTPIRGDGLQLSNATFTSNNNRSDQHQVTIGLSVGPFVETEFQAESLISKRRGNIGTVIRSLEERRIEDVIILRP